MDQQYYIQPHLAVCLPEIVSHILSFLVPAQNQEEVNNNKKKLLYANLHPCLTVNRLWHDNSSRIIWRKAFFEDTKEDFDAFLKFTSIMHQDQQQEEEELVSPTTTAIAAAALAIGGVMSTCYFDEVNRMPATTRSSSISSSTTSMIKTPSVHSFDMQLDQGDENEYLISDKIISPETLFYEIEQQDYHYSNKSIEALETASRLSTYRNALRSLTLRKIKEKSINDALSRIGPHATKLEQLDIYICDHFSNEALSPFLVHSNLTYLSLAGCHHISDEAILKVAEYCKGLEHLDLRACGMVSDVSLSAIAYNCPHLRHLNVGRIRDREKVSSKSIKLIAQHTQAAVLGLAGCDIDDACMQTLAKYRSTGLERVSVNSCNKISNETIYAYIRLCPNLSVFEMKECYRVNDWEAVAELVNRKVLLTLCDQQNKACADWARIRGRTLDVKVPLK